MAIRKMTFSVPEQLAVQFLRRIPSRDRSRFVSEALEAQLEARDHQLIRAFEAANADLDVAEIEKEFDGIRDGSLVGCARSRPRFGDSQNTALRCGFGESAQ